MLKPAFPGRWTPGFWGPFLLSSSLAVYYLLFHLDPDLYLYLLGYLHIPFPYFDLHCLVASWEAHRLGIDVMSGVNPMEVAGRGHAYSPLWMDLAFLHLGFPHHHWIGFAHVLAFCFLTGWMLRPRTPGEFLLALVIGCSSAVVLGMERINADITIYLLLILPFALPRGPQPVFLALNWLACALGTWLKYYPAAAFAVFLTLARDRRQFLLAAGAAIVSTLIFLAIYHANITRSFAIFARPMGLWTFGSDQLFRLLLPADWVRPAFLTALLVVAGGSVLAWFLRPPTPLCVPEERKEALFLSGASTLAFCFAASSNFDYRLVFVLPCVPFLSWCLRTPQWKVHGGVALFSAVLLCYFEMASLHLQILFLDQKAYLLQTPLNFAKQALSWVLFAELVFLSTRLAGQHLATKFSWIPGNSKPAR